MPLRQSLSPRARSSYRTYPSLVDGDPTRRRTGDATERIDAPAADAPPATATTVGDMRRSACPGPAVSRCSPSPAAPLATAGLHAPAADAFSGLREPAIDGFAGLRVPAMERFAGFRVPATDGAAELREPAPDGVDGLGVPAPDGDDGFHAPDADRFADAYAAAAFVGGA